MYKMTVKKLVIFDKLDTFDQENQKTYCIFRKSVIYLSYEND